MALPLVLLNRRSGGSSAALVQAILSGTAGVAWDGSDASTLFQDAAGSTPVVNAADPVGRQNTFWGAAAQNWQQATAGSRPAYDGSGIGYDGLASHFTPFSNLALLNNVPGVYYCERLTVNSLAVASLFISFGIPTASQVRFQVLFNTNGSVACWGRRLDADAVVATTSAAGVISAGVPFTIEAQVDFAGTGLQKVWINGTEVLSGSIGGSPGNTSATNSGRARKGLSVAGTGFLPGKAVRGVLAPFVMTDNQRQSIRNWVGGV